MKTSEALSALRRFAHHRAIDLDALDGASSVPLVTSWYELERFDDVHLDYSGDMLLFQWGTYDWGHGPSFHYDITRQLITEDAEDDDAIWQLHVVLHYPNGPATDALGSGNEWCSTPDELDEFRAFIAGARPTAFAIANPPSRVEISFEPAG